MVRAQLLLAALVISPAIAAPFERYEDVEAREIQEVDARSLVTAGKIFTTLATGVQMGNVFGGFFKKKPKPAESKRSFEDEFEDFSSRSEDDVEYLLVREEDGSLSVYARSPLGAAGLLKLGSSLGRVASKLKKFVLPGVAVGATAIGAAAGGNANANSRRFYDDRSEERRVGKECRN